MAITLFQQTACLAQRPHLHAWPAVAIRPEH
jgi:hypothetical protein